MKLALRTSLGFVHFQVKECIKDKACKNKVVNAAKKAGKLAGKLVGKLPGEHQDDQAQTLPLS